MIAQYFFYFFAFFTLLSAVSVVSARNPVYSVLFLILAFFSAAGVMIILGAEFLAFLLVIVYVGAVAVLFLFVVMMLNINFEALRGGFLKYFPVAGLIVAVLFIDFFLVYKNASFAAVQADDKFRTLSNTEQLGVLIYDHYFLVFQMAGLVLLTAMIGAIHLTHRSFENVRKQNISKQNIRNPKETIELIKIKAGEGVDV